MAVLFRSNIVKRFVEICDSFIMKIIDRFYSLIFFFQHKIDYTMNCLERGKKQFYINSFKYLKECFLLLLLLFRRETKFKKKMQNYIIDFIVLTRSNGTLDTFRIQQNSNFQIFTLLHFCLF